MSSTSISMEYASCQFSSALNFEVVPGFPEIWLSTRLMYRLWGAQMHWRRSCRLPLSNTNYFTGHDHSQAETCRWKAKTQFRFTFSVHSVGQRCNTVRRYSIFNPVHSNDLFVTRKQLAKDGKCLIYSFPALNLKLWHLIQQIIFFVEQQTVAKLLISFPVFLNQNIHNRLHQSILPHPNP